jgi:hypothetical protein
MIIDNKETAVGYFCPSCGSPVVSMVGVFSLSAQLLRLKCGCGGSDLTIKYERGGGDERRVTITTPCVLCPNPHIHTLGSTAFFGRDLFCLPCPVYGIDTLFIGMPEKVDDAMERVIRELNALLESAASDAEEAKAPDPDEMHMFESSAEKVVRGFGPLRRDQKSSLPDTDPQVYDIVRYVVRDLASCDGVRCCCEGGVAAPENVDIKFGEDTVTVSCSQCGASTTFGVGSVDAAQRFLHSEELILEKK